MVPNRNVIHAIYKSNCRIWSAFRKNKEYIHKHIEKQTINNIQLSVKQELTPISHLAIQSATTRLQQGRWGHSNGCLDKVGDQLPLVFTWALMSFRLSTGASWSTYMLDKHAVVKAVRSLPVAHLRRPAAKSVRTHQAFNFCLW